ERVAILRGEPDRLGEISDGGVVFTVREMQLPGIERRRRFLGLARFLRLLPARFRGCSDLGGASRTVWIGGAGRSRASRGRRRLSRAGQPPSCGFGLCLYVLFDRRSAQRAFLVPLSYRMAALPAPNGRERLVSHRLPVISPPRLVMRACFADAAAGLGSALSHPNRFRFAATSRPANSVVFDSGESP